MLYNQKFSVDDLKNIKQSREMIESLRLEEDFKAGEVSYSNDRIGNVFSSCNDDCFPSYFRNLNGCEDIIIKILNDDNKIIYEYSLGMGLYELPEDAKRVIVVKKAYTQKDRLAKERIEKNDETSILFNIIVNSNLSDTHIYKEDNKINIELPYAMLMSAFLGYLHHHSIAYSCQKPKSYVKH